MTQDFINTLLMVQYSYRQAIQKQIRELNIDLTFEMIQIMSFLYKEDHINQQTLANQTFKDKSSLSYLLNNLEKRQLLVRTEDSKDKRNKVIILTQVGRSLHKQIKSIVEGVNHKIDKSANKEYLMYCTQYMKELNNIIGNE